MSITAELHRRNDTEYFFTHHGLEIPSQIRVMMPQELKIGEQYHLSEAVFDVLGNKNITTKLLSEGVTFKLESKKTSLNKNWNLKILTERKTTTPVLKIESVIHEILGNQETSKETIFETIKDFAHTDFDPIRISNENLYCNALSFTDPFTQLATPCLRRCESWNHDDKPTGNYQFLLSKNENNYQLSLVEITSQPQQQAAVIQLYKAFLNREYGKNVVSFFEQIYEKNSPLYPEHILRCNLRALIPHQKDIDSLRDKLETAKNLQGKNILALEQVEFSSRELRCLKGMYNPKFTPIQNIESMLTANLSDFFAPTREELQRGSTGKILSQ